MESDFPVTTRDFIARHIVSVEQLEILLLLHEHRDRSWKAGEINQRLRSQEASIQKWLETLESLGLAVRSEKRYRFVPGNEALSHQIAELGDAYRERRIKVIELIFSKPNESLLNFVRAFDLRNRP